jgi:hypothetical protein
MPTATATKLSRKPAASSKPAKQSPLIEEIVELADEAYEQLRKSCFRALQIGLRLIVLHRQAQEAAGGFNAALEALHGRRIPRSTAYRWINAAGATVARLAQAPIDEIELPEIGSKEWKELEKQIQAQCQGLSLRRLTLGSAAPGEESRMDDLIQKAEQGDHLADDILEQVAAGKLTLVQAIRGHAGKTTTKDKSRKDPVYLDIDGGTGQPKGLFCKSLITLRNTFDKWDSLDETARTAARAAWKALVAQLPKDLR